ncbi:hypothetical protein COV93_07875 [Candidatus Woesearchaeota archaeon CG11_big_fil_rev_8_21_14_0_20_43_8]|nr:MAG: hypothetical protein COV93_07875 [Candidatus Woesearchaeota archaeon CG11_big_fil_rev_8_21_14_0_20_43_8]
MADDNINDRIKDILETTKDILRTSTELVLKLYQFQLLDGNLYFLPDPEGRPHIGKAYVFQMGSDPADYKFAICKRELTTDSARSLLEQKTDDLSRIYSGFDAVDKLNKFMRIKTAIAEAERNGEYEIAEHICGSHLPYDDKD